jgi:hypothetical protein
MRGNGVSPGEGRREEADHLTPGRERGAFSTSNLGDERPVSDDNADDSSTGGVPLPVARGGSGLVVADGKR